MSLNQDISFGVNDHVERLISRQLGWHTGYGRMVIRLTARGRLAVEGS